PWHATTGGPGAGGTAAGGAHTGGAGAGGVLIPFFNPREGRLFNAVSPPPSPRRSRPATRRRAKGPKGIRIARIPRKPSGQRKGPWGNGSGK
ncbi:MAG: hypothetical protein H8E30_19735, partial [Alphaproteobacteria bacterium]|nr:hypothetical protein [Alphaproteobacteria bacterium]